MVRAANPILEPTAGNRPTEHKEENQEKEEKNVLLHRDGRSIDDTESTYSCHPLTY